MKLFSRILILVCLFTLHTQLGSAASRTWTSDAFDLRSIHTMVIDKPNYSPAKNGASVEDVVAMFHRQGMDSKIYILLPEDVKKGLRRDTSLQYGTLETKDTAQAEEVYKSELDKYADAYMVATVVHNSRVVIFYDVYSAKTKELVYSYQVLASSSDDDALSTYERLTKKFYQEFEKAMKEKKK